MFETAGVLDPYNAVARWLQDHRAPDLPWPFRTPHADALWDACWVVHERDHPGLMDRWAVVAAVWPDVLVALVNRATAALIDTSCMGPTRAAIFAGDFEGGARAFAKHAGPARNVSLRAFFNGLYELLPRPPPLAALVTPSARPPPSPPPDPLSRIVHGMPEDASRAREVHHAGHDLAEALSRSQIAHFLLRYMQRAMNPEAVAEMFVTFAREVVDLLDEPDRWVLDGEPLAAYERLRALVGDEKVPRGALAAAALAELVVARRLAVADPRNALRWPTSNDGVSAGFLLHEARLHRYLRAHGGGLSRREAVEAPPHRGAVADDIRAFLPAAPVSSADLRSARTLRGVRIERVRVLRYPDVAGNTELRFHCGVNVVPLLGDDGGAAVQSLISCILRSDLPRIPTEDCALEFALLVADVRVRVEIGVEPHWVQMIVESVGDGALVNKVRASLIAATNDRTWVTDLGRLSALLRGEEASVWSRCREAVALQTGSEAYDLVAGSDLVGGRRAVARVGRDRWGYWQAGPGCLVPYEVERSLVCEAVHASDFRDGPWTSASRVPTLASLATALGFASMDIGALPPSEERVNDRLWWRFSGFRMRFIRHDGVAVSADDLDESTRSLIGLCWQLGVPDGVMWVAHPLRGLEPPAIAALTTIADVVDGRQMFIGSMADPHRMAHSRPFALPARMSVV